MLYNSLTAVQSTVTSESAAAAREVALKLQQYSGHPQYRAEFCSFARDMIKSLNACLVNMYSGKEEREVVWGCFHQLRCSDSFRYAWINFVNKATKTKPSALFYQRVTEHLFNALIEVKFQPTGQLESMATESCSNPNTITHLEENVLRYVSEYVCRKIRETLETGHHPNKDYMIFAIMEMAGDEEDEERASEQWTDSIDR